MSSEPADRGSSNGQGSVPAVGQRRVIVEQTSTGTSPLRWLLVIVPTVVLVTTIVGLLGAGFETRRQVATRDAPAPHKPPQVPSVDEVFKQPADEAPDRPIWPFDEPSSTPSPEPTVEPINPKAVLAFLPIADPARGQAEFRKCSACHDAAKDGSDKLGPNLWNVVGNAKAARPAFRYSAALKARGGIWSYEELASYLNNPRTFAPGTSMTFAGIRNAMPLAELIAYLRTRSDNPPPL
jgi:cytochrome c